jgi:hypothetical protein
LAALADDAVDEALLADEADDDAVDEALLADEDVEAASVAKRLAALGDDDPEAPRFRLD